MPPLMLGPYLAHLADGNVIQEPDDRSWTENVEIQRRCHMSWEGDEETAYRTSDDMAGRSFRRGVKKGLKAVTGAAIGGALGGPIGAAIGAALGNLAVDAAKEVPKAVSRSHEDDAD
jgi:hypothetical protein